MGGDEPGEVPGLFIQAAQLGGSIVQMAHAGTPEQITQAPGSYTGQSLRESLSVRAIPTSH